MFTERLEHLPDLLALHAARRARFPYLMMSSGESGFDMLLASEGPARLFYSSQGRAFASTRFALALSRHRF